MKPDHTKPNALLVSADLFFVSKITGTAAELGIDVTVVKSVAELAPKLVATPCRCVLVDLSTAGLRVSDMMQSLPSANRPVVIAFGSHVDVARLQEARDAGCDEVMPRSKLSAQLPEILTRFMRLGQ